MFTAATFENEDATKISEGDDAPESPRDCHARVGRGRFSTTGNHYQVGGEANGQTH